MANARTGALAVVFMLALTEPSSARQIPAAPSIIPAPASITSGPGAFVLPEQVILGGDGSAAVRALLPFVADLLSGDWGRPIAVGSSPDIALVLAPEAELRPEGYRLTVDERGVVITAPDPSGLLYGIQTLRQLRTVDSATGRTWLQIVVIRDHPRFRYRGMHLDVGRHLFPVAFIKRYLDWMAFYKMNVFHWHLTEDQGWRLEIKKYPRLTTVGAYRAETIVDKNFDPYVGDGTRYGGYYTQDEVREIVAYAAERRITVIPEIEMPGHSLAALAAYPELACTPGPFKVGTRWGVYDDIYCPSDTTFAFLEDVLTEVMALFPGPFIHVGGDEAPKARWEASPVAQAVIDQEGLEDEHELQSYFIQRIERFLHAHGRRLIGWDEILEGGLAPDATVMSWRGMDGGIAAARQGHDVIMTPGSHVYFDHYQGPPEFEPLAIGGYTPLEKVYGFEPVPPELTPNEARHILGAQANLWTEYLATPADVEYMVFPRLLALAEVVWSPPDARDWGGFRSRLPAHLARLERAGIAYRIPEVGGLETDRLVLTDTTSVVLSHPLPDAVIHFTLDGSVPTAASTVYRGPITLEPPPAGIPLTAIAVLPDGRLGPAHRAIIRRTTLRAAARVDGRRRPGLLAEYRVGRATSAARVGRLTAASRRIAASVGLTGEERPEEFAYVFRGYFDAPEDGVYQFRLTSDDGSRLWLGDDLVVDNDGLHSERSVVGMAALAHGPHPMRLVYFQGGGGRSLRLEVRRGDEPWNDDTPSWSHTPLR